MLLIKLGKLPLVVAQIMGYHWNAPKWVANVTYDSESILQNTPVFVHASSSISRNFLEILFFSIKTTHIIHLLYDF